MSSLSIFVWGLLGGAFFELLWLITRVGEAKLRGESVPPWWALFVMVGPLCFFAGVSTLIVVRPATGTQLTCGDDRGRVSRHFRPAEKHLSERQTANQSRIRG
jgi:hypothetical protein